MTMSGKPIYDPAEVESSRQTEWDKQRAFATPEPGPDQAAVYVKPSSPFTSGNLHMGHVRDYSIGDAYARFRRSRGDDSCEWIGLRLFDLEQRVLIAMHERGVLAAHG